MHCWCTPCTRTATRPSSSVTLPPRGPQDCPCPPHSPTGWSILSAPSSKLRARARAGARCQQRQRCGLEAEPAPAKAHVPQHQPGRGELWPPASPLAPPHREAQAHRSGCWRMRPRWPQRETVPWGTRPRSVCGHLQSLVPLKPPCLGQTTLAPPNPFYFPDFLPKLWTQTLPIPRGFRVLGPEPLQPLRPSWRTHPGIPSPGAPSDPGPSLAFDIHACPSIQTPGAGLLSGHNCPGPLLRKGAVCHLLLLLPQSLSSV